LLVFLVLPIIPLRKDRRWLGSVVGMAVRQRTLVTLVGLGLALVGFYLILGDIFDLSSPSGLPRNPFPPNAQSRAVGKEIYVEKCLSCHGPEGFGDGPMAKQVQGDLDLSSHVLAHPSGQIFLWITYGLGKDMPPYEDQLSEEESWHVVNYIRTFGQSSLFGIHVH
ncbi:MAG: c-type cytochrome, partial [Dehalococcoidia bacterium]|nr:c-type cytochrome [Dehalococcoidia bacterium]